MRLHEFTKRDGQPKSIISLFRDRRILKVTKGTELPEKLSKKVWLSWKPFKEKPKEEEWLGIAGSEGRWRNKD